MIDLFVAFNFNFSGRNSTVEEIMFVLQDRVLYTVCTVEHILELNLMHDIARERTSESDIFQRSLISSTVEGASRCL